MFKQKSQTIRPTYSLHGIRQVLPSSGFMRAFRFVRNYTRALYTLKKSDKPEQHNSRYIVDQGLEDNAWCRLI